MAKSVKRPQAAMTDRASRANKAAHKVTKAAKGAARPGAKPPRGKPARPEFKAGGAALGRGKPARPEFKAGGAAPARGKPARRELEAGVAPARGAGAKAKRSPKAKTPRGMVRGTGRAADRTRREQGGTGQVPTGASGGDGGGEAPRRRSEGPTIQKPRALRPRAPKDQAVEAPREVPDDRPDPSRPRAMAIAQAALDKKAEDVLVLDVRGLTSYADYFVLLTTDSERQASAVADHVDSTMKELGHTRVGSEGYETGRWILIDYGDVVAHVMSREARGFYDLEGLWADAPRFAVAG